MSEKFTIIGDGKQAKKHITAIHNIRGNLIGIYDPLKYNQTTTDFTRMINNSDYAVICSPSCYHYQQTKQVLDCNHSIKVICEKPVSMPWEPIIDDDRINVVLQYRYLDIIPNKANNVNVTMVRDAEYFQSWKGSIRDTGGMFYHLFIHYIDLAILLNATFTGEIIPNGDQSRTIDNVDILNIDMDTLYTKMYKEIVFNNNGIKTKDIRYLLWVMKKLDILHTFTLPYKRVTMNEWIVDKYGVV